MRLVFLDAGPLGVLTNPKGTPEALACQQWAVVRTGGQPTAAYEALDGDSILAAQALLAVGSGDVVTIATDNVGHLGRFVDAKTWTAIQP